MPAPAVDGEVARLAALHDLQVLDSPPDPDFDAVVELASQICGTPMALVSLIDADRQWFKAQVGPGLQQTNRDASFCAHTITGRDVLEVPDATADPRFADNPAVTGDPAVRFYAGVPIAVEGGHHVGSLCVIDTQPRDLSAQQRQALRALARHAAALMELRRYASHAAEIAEQQRRLDRMKDSFLNAVTHELRTPLSSIAGYLELLLDSDSPDPATTHRFLTVMQRNSDRLRRLVDDLVLIARLNHDGIGLNLTTLDLAELTYQLVQSSRPLAAAKQITMLEHTSSPLPVLGDIKRLSHAVNHLIFNAVKFTDAGGAITISTDSTAGEPTLTITDTGVGIAPGDIPHLFDRFYRTPDADTRADQGIGIGLSIAKAIIDAHHGSLHLTSEPGRGTTVRIILPTGD
ncbi:ATP-binding protein [Actinoplanes sp. NEAU-A12]|uniref:histidine kinase n=1 Tax=Actinoplanes sandaracinus TaxID=3045177 RepID=A0ABT6WX72_9ACTN|nr:ATP-binding protein [Actinoplanes sandaracinus]MDI6104333.1 ATP-binding protein [Actinoplanes sandaracinus]